MFVFVVKTVVWNVSDMKDKFNTVQKWIKGEKPRTGKKKISHLNSTKMDQRGKNPGQSRKKRRRHGCLSLVSVV
jgi:hypothetical protein